MNQKKQREDCFQCCLWRKVLPTPLLKRLLGLKHQVNLAQLSYWIPIVDKESQKLAPATNVIEEVVAYIHEHIFKTKVPNTRIVGIEWWIHVRRPDSYMRFHFDKDEGIWMKSRLQSHPVYSSVFYLTNDGGPTLVLDQTSSPDLLQLYPTDGPSSGALVSPAVNQYLLFPGDRLHGVLPEKPRAQLNADDEFEIIPCPPNAPPRITLMLNYWTHQLRDDTLVPYPIPPTAANSIERFGTTLDDQKDLRDTIPQVPSYNDEDDTTLIHDPNKDICMSVPIKTVDAESVHSMYYFDHSKIVQDILEERKVKSHHVQAEHDNDHKQGANAKGQKIQDGNLTTDKIRNQSFKNRKKRTESCITIEQEQKRSSKRQRNAL